MRISDMMLSKGYSRKICLDYIVPKKVLAGKKIMHILKENATRIMNEIYPECFFRT